MRAIALLLLAFATAAFAADLKPGEDLPYARLTINMPSGPNVTDQGWWDKDLHLLFHEKAGMDAANYPDERVVSIDIADPKNVHVRMPDHARKLHDEKAAALKASKTPKP